MDELIKRLKEGDLSAINKACEILDGLPQDAIDGGWTARGMSSYAKRLEDEVKALRKIARFAGLVLREHRNDGYPGDVDGDVMQQAALDCGLIEERTVHGPCGERCSCAEVISESEFPTTCYFTTELGKAALSAASDGGKS